MITINHAMMLFLRKKKERGRWQAGYERRHAIGRTGRPGSFIIRFDSVKTSYCYNDRFYWLRYGSRDQWSVSTTHSVRWKRVSFAKKWKRSCLSRRQDPLFQSNPVCRWHPQSEKYSMKRCLIKRTIYSPTIHDVLHLYLIIDQRMLTRSVNDKRCRALTSVFQFI